MIARAALQLIAVAAAIRPDVADPGLVHAADSATALVVAGTAAAIAVRVGGPAALALESAALVGLFGVAAIHAAFVLRSCAAAGELGCGMLAERSPVLGWQLPVGIAVGVIVGGLVPRIPARVQAVLAAAGALGILLLPATARPLGLAAISPGAALEKFTRVVIALAAGVTGALVLSSSASLFAAMAFGLLLAANWVAGDSLTVLAAAQGDALGVLDALVIPVAGVSLLAVAAWNRHRS